MFYICAHKGSWYLVGTSGIELIEFEYEELLVSKCEGKIYEEKTN